jgi:hypothetical protein
LADFFCRFILRYFGHFATKNALERADSDAEWANTDAVWILNITQTKQ